MRRIPLDQRRAELIAAAIRVIARDGLTAATTRAIVLEADMPLGAFHYAFTSRDELIAAVIDEVTDAERMAALSAAAGAVVEATAESHADLEGLLQRGMEGYLDYLEQSPSSELALFEVALHGARHNPEAVKRQWATYRRSAEDLLVRAAELGGVRWRTPIAELAHSLTRSIDGLTVTWLADRDTDAARAHIRFLAAAFAAQGISAGERQSTTASDPTSTRSPKGHDADLHR